MLRPTNASSFARFLRPNVTVRSRWVGSADFHVRFCSNKRGFKRGFTGGFNESNEDNTADRTSRDRPTLTAPEFRTRKPQTKERQGLRPQTKERQGGEKKKYMSQNRVRLARTNARGEWECPTQLCKMWNMGNRKSCFLCKTIRPGDQEKWDHQKKMQPDGYGTADYNCLVCGTHNFAFREKCWRCKQTRKLDKGEWRCSCKAHNFRANARCFDCNKPRPTSADRERAKTRRNNSGKK